MKISTIVCVVDLGIKINIPVFMEFFPSKELDSIEDVIYNNFGNQITIIFNLHKKINVKLFNNGKMQITGLTENYKKEIQQIVDILYTNGKNISGEQTKECIKNKDTNLLVYNNSEIYGYNYASKHFEMIGEIKKNDIHYIHNQEVIPFNIEECILTTKKHIDMKKEIIDINGTVIGEIDYIIKGGKILKEEYDKNIHTIISEVSSEKEYFLRRKIKNLTLKNKTLKKFNDDTYLLFNNSKKDIDVKYSKDNILTEEIMNIYHLNAIVKIKYNSNYNNFLTFLNENKNDSIINIKYSLFSDLNFTSNYSVSVANINTDLTIDKKNETDLFNLYTFLNEFQNYHFLYKKIITYEPSKYPAIKITFPDLSTSVRIFKTFKFKFSGNNLDNINIIKNNLIKFIEEKYNSIIISTKKVEIIETLDIKDLL